MAFIGPNNAIAWAHFRLRGGLRKSLSVAGGFFMLAAIGAFFHARLDPKLASGTLFGWAMGMLAVQGAVLAIYVSTRISVAIRQDMTSKMIESHRLMPMPASHAIAGYIIGAALQPLILAGAIFLFGGICAVMAGCDWQRWLMANLVLLVFSMFAWVLSGFLGFQKRGFNLLIFLPIVFPTIIGGAIILLPALVVLLSPILGGGIFSLKSSLTDVPWTYVLAIVAQSYFASIFFIGAARRYRDPDALGLTPLMGLAGVAGWVVLTLLATSIWDTLKPTAFGRMEDPYPEFQAIAGMIVAMLLSLTPISAAARLRAERSKRHRLQEETSASRRSLPLVAVLGVVAVLPLLIPAYSVGASKIITLWQALVMLIAFAVGMYFAFRFLYEIFNSAAILGFVWLLLICAVPIGADLIRYGLSNDYDAKPLSTLATCSPIGGLIVLLTNKPVDPTWGIVVQLLVMLVPATLLLIVKRSQHRQSIPASASE
jgi:hypothetical protein